MQIKVLLIDDDKLIRWSLKEILSQEGYQVDDVDTVDDALKQAKNKLYNLIFVDIEINSEDGIEMLKKIRVFQPEAKITILSAVSRQQIEPRLSDLNIFSIIEKPFQSEQIRSIAREALNLLSHIPGGDERKTRKTLKKDNESYNKNK